MPISETVGLCLALPLPLLFAFLGALILNHPPRVINDVFGYRTALSKKNQRNWDYAQILGGKTLLISGISATVLALLLFFISVTDDGYLTVIVSVVVSIVVLIVGVIVDEILLDRFDRGQ
jgi:uncharacterized membrane protein